MRTAGAFGSADELAARGSAVVALVCSLSVGKAAALLLLGFLAGGRGATFFPESPALRGELGGDALGDRGEGPRTEP